MDASIARRETESLAPDYIYLSYVHWDHFHGVTLRKLGTSRTVLAPRTPGTRKIDGSSRAIVSNRRTNVEILP
jgi:metal-dependent hydrolase (beta-lactamase superfamily II)